MGNPMDHPDFQTLMDANFSAIRDEEVADMDDIIGSIYTVINSTRPYEQYGDIGAAGLWPEFDGAVDYDTIVEEYNSRGDPREYVTGMRWTKRMIDDDLTGLLEDRFRPMVNSGVLTRQDNATRLFENFFLNDTHFYTRSEGLALGSDSHTTRHPGVSTTVGFDNLMTAPLTQTSVRAMLILGRKIADNRGQRSNIVFDEVYVPIDRTPDAEEIFLTATTPGTANLTINPEASSRSRIKIVTIPRWSSTVNWGMGNSRLRKRNAYWIERIAPDYGSMEEFDSYQIKVRGYQRHGTVVRGWRWAAWSRVG